MHIKRGHLGIYREDIEEDIHGKKWQIHYKWQNDTRINILIDTSLKLINIHQSFRDIGVFVIKIKWT